MECGFEYHVIDKIPPLSWCAVLSKENKADIFCGNGVECAQQSFVEGAWNGKYERKEIEKATFLCGSGCVLKQNAKNRGGYCFVSPSHVLEKIVIIKKEKLLFVSNSVPFALEKAGCDLDSSYLDYEKDFSSILNGLSLYKKDIPLSDGQVLSCYYYCNILIDSDLNICEIEKPIIEPVADYDDYFNSLVSDMKLLKENASDSCRHKRYGIVTTISSGYDAAACSAIARKIGCNTALTFDSPEKYSSDCGDKIAEKLGFQHIIKKNANAYLTRKDLIEAEHVCSGELGTSIIFSAFEDEFRDNLVFYGERGDKIWNKNWGSPNDDFRFENELFAGISMAESRLRIGFILVPMPMYKAATWTSIHAVSNSEEMRPWSMFNNYDRPIPRRIVEECGVSRGLFGQEKKGAGFNYHFDNLKRLKFRMSDQSYGDFANYYKQNRRARQTLNLLSYYCKMYPVYLNYLFRVMHLKFQIKTSQKMVNNPGAPSYLINWGIKIMKERYNG